MGVTIIWQIKLITSLYFCILLWFQTMTKPKSKLSLNTKNSRKRRRTKPNIYITDSDVNDSAVSHCKTPISEERFALEFHMHLLIRKFEVLYWKICKCMNKYYRTRTTQPIRYLCQNSYINSFPAVHVCCGICVSRNLVSSTGETKYCCLIKI